MDNAKYQTEAALAPDVVGLRTLPTLGVSAAAVVQRLKVMERYAILAIGTARARSLLASRPGLLLEASNDLIDQSAVMDLADGTPLHGVKVDPQDLTQGRDLRGVNLWRDQSWSEPQPRQSRTTSGEPR